MKKQFSRTAALNMRARIGGILVTLTMTQPMIIAIDGPSGSGKSTLGRMLARALNLLYIDTGSMYRAMALAVIEAKIDPSAADSVTALANRIEIELAGNPDSLKVLLDGRDVTNEIR